MKITAETITDEQIHELWRLAVGSTLSDVNPDLMHDCTVAVNIKGDHPRGHQADARARCVDAWNARKLDEAITELEETGDSLRETAREHRQALRDAESRPISCSSPPTPAQSSDRSRSRRLPR